MRERLQAVAPIVMAYTVLVAAGLVCLRYATPVIVSGGSMRPALDPGDIVLVSRGAQTRVGDIALIRSGAGLVLHRVTGLAHGGSIRTRGDANPVADVGATSGKDIRGRVVAILPFGSLLERWRRLIACDTLPAQPHSSKLRRRRRPSHNSADQGRARVTGRAARTDGERRFTPAAVT